MGKCVSTGNSDKDHATEINTDANKDPLKMTVSAPILKNYWSEIHVNRFTQSNNEQISKQILLNINIISHFRHFKHSHLYAPQNWLATETQESNSSPICLLSV